MKIAAIALSLFHNVKYFAGGESAVKSVFAALPVDTLPPLILQEPCELLPALYKASLGYDAICIGYIDSPFYCQKENLRLLKNFLQYRGDFGFGDDFPQGVLFEIVRREILPILENLRKQSHISVSRNLFQDLIQKDVNMFDLENLYAKTDLRTFRLSFFCDNQQDSLVTFSLINKIQSLGKTFNKNFFFEDLANLILENRNVLRYIPKYYEIQISTIKQQECIYSPPQSKETFLPFEKYKIMLEKIQQFCDNPVIGINGNEDPLGNPDFFSIIEKNLQENVTCLVETPLAGATAEIVKKLLQFEDHKNFLLILFIDAIEESLYRKIRPYTKTEFAQIMYFAEQILLTRPQNTYVQITKMDKNFEHIPAFYKHFTQFTSNIIVQKYNHYRNILPERRINPMKPFHPIDCWHLKRDLFIHPEGEVTVCKQDIKKEFVLGNLQNEKIETIFKEGEHFFEKHIQGWEFCKSCDENYTYNF